MSETKKCPFCAEVIALEAKKCKHCGEFLDNELKKSIKTKPIYKNEVLGQLMLTVPIITMIVTYFWISNLRITDGPDTVLTILSVICLVFTTVLATIEANLLNMGNFNDLNKNGKKNEGPVIWFISLILLWIVFYPIYLGKRARYGLKSYWVGGLVIALLFISSIVLWQMRIEKLTRDYNREIQSLYRNQ